MLIVLFYYGFYYYFAFVEAWQESASESYSTIIFGVGRGYFLGYWSLCWEEAGCEKVEVCSALTYFLLVFEEFIKSNAPYKSIFYKAGFEIFLWGESIGELWKVTLGDAILLFGTNYLSFLLPLIDFKLVFNEFWEEFGILLLLSNFNSSIFYNFFSFFLFFLCLSSLAFDKISKMEVDIFFFFRPYSGLPLWDSFCAYFFASRLRLD